jgi:chromosomal replication initiator protein
MLKDFRTVWAACLRTIAAEIGEQSFRTWFQPIVPVELKENVLTIQVPSAYFYDWLEEHYVDELRRALFQELGPEGRLEYSVVVDQGNDQARPKTLHPTRAIPPPCRRECRIHWRAAPGPPRRATWPQMPWRASRPW